MNQKDNDNLRDESKKWLQTGLLLVVCGIGAVVIESFAKSGLALYGIIPATWIGITALILGIIFVIKGLVR